MYQDPLQCTFKIAGLSLEDFFEAKIISGPCYLKSPRLVRKSADSFVMATSRKLLIAVRLLNLTLTANLFLQFLGRWRGAICCIRQKIQVFPRLSPTNWLIHTLGLLTSRLLPATKFCSAILT